MKSETRSLAVQLYAARNSTIRPRRSCISQVVTWVASNMPRAGSSLGEDPGSAWSRTRCLDMALPIASQPDPISASLGTLPRNFRPVRACPGPVWWFIAISRQAAAPATKVGQQGAARPDSAWMRVRRRGIFRSPCRPFRALCGSGITGICVACPAVFLPQSPQSQEWIYSSFHRKVYPFGVSVVRGAAFSIVSSQ